MRDADGRDAEQRTEVDGQASVPWVIAAGAADSGQPYGPTMPSRVAGLNLSGSSNQTLSD